MPLKRIGDILLDSKLLTQKQLDMALKQQKPSEKLGETFIRLGLLNEMQILKALEETTHIKRISLQNYDYDPEAIKIIPEAFCRHHVVIPLRIDNQRILYATSDPLNFEVGEEIRMITGYRSVAYSAPKNSILSDIDRLYDYKNTLEALGVKETAKEHVEIQLEETPMVKLVNQIFSGAVFQRASDIHIDPQDRSTLIRYRIDGILQTVRELPTDIHRQVINRIKIMADMDITESRVPQDGRLQTKVVDKTLDMRVSTLPTIRGEKIVLRILDISSNLSNVDSLGLNHEDEKVVRKMIHKPNGIILVSGPTGSGKTTTLYAFLNELNQPDKNIVSVEDPVEIKMPGINQVQVHTDIDLTFANVLRSILRQDPNIIMVGEIRDSETAEIAIRAALTGHLVLSTIHTNSSLKTITRLLDMGIEPFLIASSLSGVISQRLVRKLCTECSYHEAPNETERALMEKYGLDPNQMLKRAKGCASCNHTGYQSRIGLFEILPISKDMEAKISRNDDYSSLEKQAKKEKLKPLIVRGLEAVQEGLTTIEEVLKVTSD